MNIPTIKYYACGHCSLWMTKNCPREHLGKDGQSRGPDCDAPQCNQFNMDSWYAKKEAADEEV